MTAGQIFQIANMVSLVAWLGLLFLPRIKVVTDFVAQVLVPCLFAAAYAVILGRFFDPKGFENFATLEGLALLQGSPWLLLAGWLHYLAFDLFVGSWEVRTARSEGIPHLAIVPSLVLTFMLGPLGLLVFILTRFAIRRRISAGSV